MLFHCKLLASGICMCKLSGAAAGEADCIVKYLAFIRFSPRHLIRMWGQESDNARWLLLPETGAQRRRENIRSRFLAAEHSRRACVCFTSGVPKKRRAAVKEEEIIINRAEQR
jgi:hypothetical protein